MADDDGKLADGNADQRLAEGIRLIRLALHHAFGSEISLKGESTAPPTIEECQAIAQAITLAGEQYEIALDRLDAVAVAQRRTTVRVFIWCLAVVSLLAAYTAWPLLGLHKLARAIEARNAALLGELVDFPSLRRSVAEQVMASYLKITGKDSGLGTFTKSILVGTAASVVDPIVGRSINPENLIDLLGRGAVANTAVSVGAAPISTSSLSSALRLWLGSEYSLRNFYIRMPPDVEPPQQFRLKLRLTAGVWRLESIDLPEEIRTQLAREVIKANE